ncbi:MAG: tetratricopeptide repeat protein [Verrucomicrobia bacterium]|nr:tetratricopeptide repeat protein [Verrucomicrobiota bacterium]
MHRPPYVVRYALVSASAPHSSRETLLRWRLALGVFALLIVFFSPSWGAFRLWSRVPEMGGMLEVRRGVSVLAQVAHPGAPIADELHRAIQWRLFFPVLGHYLGLPPTLFFGLAHAGCLLVLGYFVTLLRRAAFNWTDTALATCTLGAASWFFTSTGWLGYFDSWLALALLLAAFAESSWVAWTACLLAPWIDERFVAAAPLALFCRWLHRPGKFDLKRDAGVPAALLAAFLLVRFGLLSAKSAAGATLGGYLGSRDFLDAPFSRIALGLWEGLRGGWAFVAAGIVALWPQRSRSLALGAGVLVLAAMGLATAQDYSRSMTMLLPAAVLGTLLAHGAAWLPALTRTAAIVAMIVPAHHVMNDRVNPIFNLQHELNVLDQPPAIAMPELYELRAIHAMERGDFRAADADLALAIKLATNPASPAKQRGILAATQGRWPDARTYFSLMAQHDPKNPDAWLMCAQASLALGESATARSEIARALPLAPVDWKTRPDVARFLAKLDATR